MTAEAKIKKMDEDILQLEDQNSKFLKVTSGMTSQHFYSDVESLQMCVCVVCGDVKSLQTFSLKPFLVPHSLFRRKNCWRIVWVR